MTILCASPEAVKYINETDDVVPDELCLVCQQMKEKKEFQVSVTIRRKWSGQYIGILEYDDVVVFESDDKDKVVDSFLFISEGIE